MIQMTSFYGYAVEGQKACYQATQRANAALAVLNVTPERLLGRDVSYVSYYNAETDTSSSECVITLTLQTDVPFTRDFLSDLQGNINVFIKQCNSSFEEDEEQPDLDTSDRDEQA